MKWPELRVVQKVSYADAFKKIEDGSIAKDPERIPVSSRFVPAQTDRATGDLCFGKVGFLACIAMVINYTAERRMCNIKSYTG